jgi:hypothetical protein
MPSKSFLKVLLGSLVLTVAAGSALAAQTCPTPMASMFPPAPGAFTYTAMADGGWKLPATWGGTTIPGNGDIVCIPAGRTVTVTRQETARLRFIQVDGVLKMAINSDTRLLVDTLLMDAGGSFQIGLPANPLAPGSSAELVFISWDGNPIDRTWDPEEKSRGLISMGTVKAYGDAKTHMEPLTADVLKGSTHLVVDSAPSNWQVGDTLVLTGSYFREVPSGTSTSQDEQIAITAITGNAIDFKTVPANGALIYDHVRPRGDLHLHVANLTRNLVFRSEVPGSLPLRGHVMMMTGDVALSNVALVDLGRTDKTRPLDDVIVQCKLGGVLQPCDGSDSQTDYSVVANAVNAVTNRRGRYALHFHLNGITPGAPSPATVVNSVVNGTPGWAFVSHSSQVDFKNDVAYNFAGAGFVTEAGNELGTFDNDIAIRGTGDGEYRPNQIIFANPDRPQPLADFGFSGDGFWFQGPAIHATNNVAAGCNGVGMIWFTTGQPDIKSLFTDTSGLSHDHYTSFPRSALSAVYGSAASSLVPRYWDTSVTNENVVIGDLPILQCDGLESYGNLVGFRLRFNNFNPQNTQAPWYNEFFYDQHIIVPTGQAGLRQALNNIKAWNNEYGIYPNYTSMGDWSNVTLVNRLDFDARDPHAGATIDRQLDDSKFQNLTIDGYEVAGMIELINSSSHFNNRGEITFTTPPTYLNYANFDTWDMTASCATLAAVTVTPVSPTSRTLSWTPNGTSTAIQKRYLVRYRAAGAQQWKLVDTTGSSATLAGLTTGTTYTYQVMAGCQDAGGTETTPSKYTVAATFNT